MSNPVEETKKSRLAKGERRIQILQMLAQMLENPAGDKITTAGLAKALDVSEAALYRHFASKAQMYESLIEFIESSLLGLLNQIGQSDVAPMDQLKKMLQVQLTFVSKNPGMARVLIGDVLMHENERLQVRINQLIDRLGATMKQTLRNAAIESDWKPVVDVNAYSEMLTQLMMGRWHMFVRSGFTVSPLAHFEEMWQILGLQHN